MRFRGDSGDADPRSDEAGGTPPALLGRAEQLGVLLRQFHEATASSAPRFVVVKGEAGIGKSTFLQALRAEIEIADPTARVAYGRALAQHSVSNGFQPVREAIADLLKSAGREERKVQRIATAFRTAAPDWLAAVPIVGDVLSASAQTAAEYATAGGALKLDTSLTRQFCDLVRALAAETPFVLILDDLHWSDASTVDLFYSLTQLVDDVPLLLVGAYRPDDLEAISGDGSRHPFLETLLRIKRYLDLTEVDLDRLESSEVTVLAQRALGRPAPRELVQELHAITSGNPLFVNEYLGLLIDELAGEHSADAMLDRLRALRGGVPDRVEAVIAERLLRLDQDERRVLEVASTLGSVFSPNDLMALVDVESSRARHALRSLCRRHALLAPVEGDGAGAYAFHHGTVAHVLQAGLRKDDPYDYRDLHTRAGRYLNDRGLSHLGDHERYAHHAFASGDLDWALSAALGASRVAWSLGAVAEALQNLERVTGQLTHRFRDRELLQQSVLLQLQAYNATGDHSSAASFGELAAARLGELSPRVVLATARGQRMTNDWSGARASLGSLAGVGDVAAEVAALEGEIALCGIPPSPALARGHFEIALQRTDDPELAYRAQGHIGLCWLAEYDVERAFRHLDAALVTATQVPHPWFSYEARHWRNKAEMACLRLEEAALSLDFLEQVASSSGVASTVPFHLRDRSRVQGLAGDGAAAACTCIQYAEAVHGLLNDMQWRRALATIACQAMELRTLGRGLEAFTAVLSGELGTSALDATARELVWLAWEAGTAASSRAALRQALSDALAVTVQTFDAADALFRFDVEDLSRLRPGV